MLAIRCCDQFGPSGTLIAPDLVATAGHCINDGSCSGVKVVFHATDQTMTPGNTVPANTVYQCDRVETSVLTSGKDYAVFKLDRPVPPWVATPVTVGSDAMPAGAGLMMIGHPSGAAELRLLPTLYLGSAIYPCVQLALFLGLPWHWPRKFKGRPLLHRHNHRHQRSFGGPAPCQSELMFCGRRTDPLVAMPFAMHDTQASRVSTPATRPRSA